MTPEVLADIHRQSFETPAPWDAAAFSVFLGDPAVTLITKGQGFILLRSAAHEVEILTLAVLPSARRKGLALDLVTQGLEFARRDGAKTMFLEVSSQNPAGISLYGKLGFAQIGRRKRYYQTPDGPRVDAIIMSRVVT